LDFATNWPSLPLLFLAMAPAVAAACGGRWYLHRHVPEEDFARHNEVGSVIIAIAGTLRPKDLGASNAQSATLEKLGISTTCAGAAALRIRGYSATRSGASTC
jgi:hypothetical protein